MSDRCQSRYGPEQVQCTKRVEEPHEWHTGSGVNPDDDEPYGAAWLSHWEPGLTDRTTL